MIRHDEMNDFEVRTGIKNKRLNLAGNIKDKIYGKLNCTSGKRMKKHNRVFFISEKEAVEQGFRPCGHCMRNKYKKIKNDFI